MRWRYRETVLALSTLAFFATMVARLAISPVVPAIRGDFGVSNAVVGLALTGMWMSYFLAQFPSGVLADRFGERPVILIAVGGTALASCFVGIAPLFALFVLAAIALGSLAGLHYTVATTLLTRVYDDIGTAMGLHNSGAPAAGLVAPALSAWIGARYGWRPAVAIGAAAAVPVFVLFAWRVRPEPPRRPDQPMRERFELEPVLELVSRPPIAFTVFLSVLCAFVWQGTASFLPTFLVEYRGQSGTTAGVVFSAYFVVHGITQVGIGAASDRYGRYVTTAGCMILATAGFAGLIVASSVAGALAAIVLVATGMGWSAALLPRFMDLLSEGERGAGFGLVRTVYGVVGALGSVGTGLFADVFGWAVSFGVLAGLLATVLAALVVNWTLELGY